MSVSDEVKQRIDLVDYISRYTSLRKTGSTYKGLCPFHDERTPSFVVFPHTQTWHCFGACSTGGDLLSFAMRKENMDFREALQLLAQEAGVELDDKASGQEQSLRARIYEANAAAAAYFQQILATHPAAEPARTYLAERGIDDATADRFQLGYSLDQWSGLRDHLLAQQFDIDLLLQAGLIKRSEARNSTYDAFRGRVIIPIRDRLGRVIGFGGRVLDGSQPKYLNTADTAVFHKSHIVYGLDLAHEAIRSADRVVIVEGYMDVIAAHQFGFTNVVACMGTALTADQLQQLQRYSGNYVLALDADAAGQQATIRGLNQARQALGRVRKPTVTAGGLRMEDRLGAMLHIAAMPPGRDPDDVLRQDPELWQQLIDQAKPLVDFYFTVVAEEMDLSSAQGKGAAVTELAPLIAELDDEIEREHYIQQLARLVQIDERTIAGRVHAAAKTNQAVSGRRSHDRRDEGHRRGGRTGREWGNSERGSRFGNRPPNEPPPADAAPDAGPETADGFEPRPATPAPARARQGLSSEDYILAHLLQTPDLLIWLTQAAEEREIRPIDVADCQHVENQEILRALKQFMSSDSTWDLELFQESLPPELHGRLAHLTAAGAELPAANNAEVRTDLLKVLVRLRLERLKHRSMQIKYLIDEAAQSGIAQDTRDLYGVNNQMLRELSHLQSKFHELSRVLAGQGRADQGVKIR